MYIFTFFFIISIRHSSRQIISFTYTRAYTLFISNKNRNYHQSDTGGIWELVFILFSLTKTKNNNKKNSFSLIWYLLLVCMFISCNNERRLIARARTHTHTINIKICFFLCFDIYDYVRMHKFACNTISLHIMKDKKKTTPNASNM